MQSQQFLSTPSARRATIPEYYWRKLEAISIHALREEGDWKRSNARRHQAVFLSTPSARRATSRGQQARGVTKYFYPRPPRGGRHFPSTLWVSTEDISIHALREEGDVAQYVRFPIVVKISIHALREEGDRHA